MGGREIERWRDGGTMGLGEGRNGLRTDKLAGGKNRVLSDMNEPN